MCVFVCGWVWETSGCQKKKPEGKKKTLLFCLARNKSWEFACCLGQADKQDHESVMLFFSGIFFFWPHSLLATLLRKLNGKGGGRRRKKV